MQILLVSQWYSPEPVRVVEELASGLRDLGHEVEVLTGFPNYPTGKIYDGYRLRPWKRERRVDIPLQRVGLYPDHSQSPIGRLLNYGSFAASATLFGPFLAKKPDVVLVYASPATAAFPARWIAALRGVPCVVHVADLWPEAFRAVGVRNRFILGALERYSRWAYRGAAEVIAVSEGFAHALVEKGVAREKVHHIPMWVDASMYRAADSDDEMRRRLGITDKTVIMYAGHIGIAQGLDTVIDAAALLRDRDDVELVLVGDGSARESLQQKVAELQLPNVRFPGSFAPEEMARVYAHASALVVHLADDPVFRMWIPHKVFAYMAVAKPVLCAVAGETADIVTRAGAGLVCEPNRPDQLADLVRRIADLPEDARAEMGRAGRRTIESEYEQHVLIRRIAAVLERAVSLV